MPHEQHEDIQRGGFKGCARRGASAAGHGAPARRSTSERMALKTRQEDRTTSSHIGHRMRLAPTNRRHQPAQCVSGDWVSQWVFSELLFIVSRYGTRCCTVVTTVVVPARAQPHG